MHWYDEGEFWVITKYDDIKYISTHPLLFSSKEHRDHLGARAAAERCAEAADGRTARRHVHGPARSTVRYRKVVSCRFTPKMVERARRPRAHGDPGLVDGAARRRVRPDRARRGAGAGLRVLEAARHPRDDWHQVVEWATIIANQGSGQGTPDDMDVIFNVVGPYLWDLVTERRAATRPTICYVVHASRVRRPSARRRRDHRVRTDAARGGQRDDAEPDRGLGHVLTAVPRPGGRVLRRSRRRRWRATWSRRRCAGGRR